MTPYLDFGGQGDYLHFAHANAYPPGAYRQLLAPLTHKYRVLAVQHRPLWPGHQPEEMKSWELIAQDLIRFLDERGLKSIVGVGHSMGGVATLMAAHQRPDLFSRLVLLEPVMLPQHLLTIGSLMPLWLRRRTIPIVKQALRRRNHWPDSTAMFNHFRPKKVFRRFSDAVLWDYIHASALPSTDGQVTLAYSREWEAQVYCHAPQYRKLRHNLQVPTLSIRGEATDAIDPKEWSRWKNSQTAQLLTIPEAGHLVPLEHPDLIAEHILTWLQQEVKPKFSPQQKLH